MTHFERHFNLDSMLREDAVWLSVQVELPKEEFLDIAKKLDLRQEDWDTFWKEMRGNKQDEEDMASMDRDIQFYKMEVEDLRRELAKKKEGNIDCEIFGREWELTEDEFEFVKQLLGEPTGEVSNCCGGEIYEPIINHTARCPECKEGCGVVYLWINGKEGWLDEIRSRDIKIYNLEKRLKKDGKEV